MFLFYSFLCFCTGNESSLLVANICVRLQAEINLESIFTPGQRAPQDGN